MPKAATQSEIEAKLRATEQRYQAFMHNSQEGIWRFELDKPISITLPPKKQITLVFERAWLAEANDAMAKMYGLEKADQLIGTRLTELMDQTVQQNIEYLQSFIDSGYSLQGVETEEIDHDGNKKYFLNSLIGIIEDGSISRAWGTQLDVTEQHQTTAALKESEERLALALKASHVGMWEWRVTTNELWWSEELRKIFNFDLTEPITFETYIARVHPEDRQLIADTVAGSQKTGAPYEFEHRIIWPNKEVHWVHSRGRAILENGKPVRMIGTCMNVDEAKAAEDLKVKNALLNTERKELMRLSKSKDEFIALASHQLRTPATSVKQYLGMLLEGFTGELKLTDTQLGLLQTAYDSNERQIEIVNDLLLVATIDAGKVSLEKHSIDIIECLQEIIDDYTHKFKDHGQKLVFEHIENSLPTMIDAVRHRMAIENLLDNASKYSPEGATTTLTVTKTNDSVHIAINDQGVGIDAKDFKKLFQKFSRIPNSLSTSSGGSGLGLYWANKIVELHGGKLHVASTPGKGSTFTITLY